MHTYQVRLVNSRCLYETTLKDETIDRVKLPIRLVDSHCLHETTLKFETIVRLY